MRGRAARHAERKYGFVLAMVVLAMFVLTILGVGLLRISYGIRLRAIKAKNETAAMLAAEAGYEKAIFWMSQQADILGGLQSGLSGTAGTISFGNSECAYSVQFHDYIGARPIFRITSTGSCAAFSRAVDAYVMQAITGWDMGMCRVPGAPSTTYPVYFTGQEVIDTWLHINNHKDSPDQRDIYISGSPQFLQKVEMGEPRHTDAGTDKYSSVMELFSGGIYFNQPDVRITDGTAVQLKVQRFHDSTKPGYQLRPVGSANISSRHSAVQLEFYVDSGVGKARITNNCSVRGYRRTSNIYDTWDYKIVPGGGGGTYEKYDIYCYHYKPDDEASFTCALEDTYVTQTFAGKTSDPGGQIYVDGHVVVGSDDFDQMVVKGKLTIVAAGNIWIADSIVVDGAHDASTGLPASDNPNVLGLIAEGIVKVIDPGISGYSTGAPNYYPGVPAASVPDFADPTKTHSYEPVGNGTGTDRYLPDPMVVEAAITVGGGGWGAENVSRGNYGGRKEASGIQDILVLRGSISEAIRSVVGRVTADGYIKRYYLDARLLEGVLPGNIWFGGKFVPAPAGWRDYRPSN